MSRPRILSLLFALLLPTLMFASSHREAPLISEDPTMDATDVYAFRSPDAPDTITIIANYIPDQSPAGGPNFYNFSNGVYEIHIDNNGDATEDITYQFQFRKVIGNTDTFLYNVGPVTTLSDADLNVKQFYEVFRISGPRRTGTRTSLGSNFQVAPANIGPKSTPDYAALATAAISNLASGGKVYAGPRDDPFFVDLGSIFDLLTLRPVQQLHLVPPMRASEPGVNNLAGKNVHTIAIQVPISQLVASGGTPTSPTAANAVIGIWTTSSRSRISILNAGAAGRQTVGGLSQVSRLGSPLVNEVVVPLSSKDIFNSSHPSGDAAFAPKVLDPEVPKLLKLLYNIDSPPAPRNDLVQVFLTGVPGATMPPNVVASEQLRLNVAVPVTASQSVNRLGVIGGDLGGFPNGRRLGDDVIDIALRVMAGVLVPAFNRAPNNALTDGVDSNDRPFLSTFPYMALPHQGYESRPPVSAAN